MFFSFGRTLRGLGGVRVGIRMRGSQGCFYACLFMCINACIYMMWYTLLGMLWLCYGMCYLMFYLPIKGCIKLYRNWSFKKKMAEAERRYTRPTDNAE